jgi:hypothetical protein
MENSLILGKMPGWGPGTGAKTPGGFLRRFFMLFEVFKQKTAGIALYTLYIDKKSENQYYYIMMKFRRFHAV